LQSFDRRFGFLFALALSIQPRREGTEKSKE
jgi:hypothetical protein